MKPNKNIFTRLILTSALIITGCEHDNDLVNVINSANHGPIVNKEFKYTIYDMCGDVDEANYKTAWGKLEFNINSDGLMRNISTVRGSTPTTYQDSKGDEDDDLDYYVGDKVFVKIRDEYDSKFDKIDFVDSDTFVLSLQTDNNPIHLTYDIVTLDLKGVGKLAADAKTGITTDLEYPYFPNNITFPTGSKCYIMHETPEQSYYTFYDSASTEDVTIDEWIAQQKDSGKTLNNLVKEMVGRHNELSAARYTNNNGRIKAVVSYNGLLHNAHYYKAGAQQDANISAKTGIVNCDQYNDIASKFLDQQIIANYNK